jgi:hypothetical protein
MKYRVRNKYYKTLFKYFIHIESAILYYNQLEAITVDRWILEYSEDTKTWYILHNIKLLRV